MRPVCRPSAPSQLERRVFIHRRPIVLFTGRNYMQLFVWQWPLQRGGIVNRAIKPKVPLVGMRQKYRHGLGMNRLHNFVRFRGQERKEPMLAGLALSLACP